MDVKLFTLESMKLIHMSTSVVPIKTPIKTDRDKYGQLIITKRKIL